MVVWVVMAEVNDHKDIYRICGTEEKAFEVRRRLVEVGKYDYVYILEKPIY